MRKRIAQITLLAAGAVPAYAHGEQLVFLYLAVLWGMPALAFAFIPWHSSGLVRLMVAALPIAAGILAFYLLSQFRWGESGPPVGFFIAAVVGPPVCSGAMALALALRRRRQAEVEQP